MNLNHLKADLLHVDRYSVLTPPPPHHPHRIMFGVKWTNLAQNFWLEHHALRILKYSRHLFGDRKHFEIKTKTCVLYLSLFGFSIFVFRACTYLYEIRLAILSYSKLDQEYSQVHSAFVFLLFDLLIIESEHKLAKAYYPQKDKPLREGWQSLLITALRAVLLCNVDLLIGWLFLLCDVIAWSFPLTVIKEERLQVITDKQASMSAWLLQNLWTCKEGKVPRITAKRGRKLAVVLSRSRNRD